ncbi:D-alanyl-D-alanine carboxypeptidase family protein [Streptomyces sp. CA-294286]|uniref:D-alanyl-D-alanine carboxypeptidase family protein n=1 Tax=Streptomyces sp. CA-294286 TaxID=3240070 RepID=UPI003D8E06A3
MRPFASPSLRHVLAVLAATAVTALAGAPAAAAGGNDAARTLPAHMSTAGGELLGRPGPQVGAGAPALPHGISALSWIVADADTGQVLAAANAHWALPPASTLKMLFADTVLPVVPHGVRHRVTGDELRGMGAGSSAVGVVPGQQYAAADLWRGVFLRSGNDAVHVLAAMNGGVAKTVADMQKRAEDLGARDTQVRSPDGYDTPGQVSSAYDLALFLRAGLKNADFREYCSTADAEFPGGPGTRGKPFGIANTNRMLSGIGGVAKYPGLIGGKNGYTTHAGNTLAEAARRDGRTLLVTVMNPQTHRPDDVYTQTRSLLDWGFSAVGRAAPVGSLDPVAPAPAAPPSPRGAGGASAAESSSAPLGALGWTGAGASAVVAGGAVLLAARRRGSGRVRAGHAAAPAARRAGTGRRRRG